MSTYFRPGQFNNRKRLAIVTSLFVWSLLRGLFNLIGFPFLYNLQALCSTIDHLESSKFLLFRALTWNFVLF